MRWHHLIFVALLLLLLIILIITNKFLPQTGYIVKTNGSVAPIISLNAELVEETSLNVSGMERIFECPVEREFDLEIKNIGMHKAELVSISKNKLNLKCEPCIIESIPSNSSAFMKIKICYLDENWFLLIKAANAKPIRISK